jgi:UDP-galactopyranose mutase
VHDLVKGLAGGLFSQQREARVWTHGVLIPYPFQRFFHSIPDADVVKACREGMRSAAGSEDAVDLASYLLGKFGSGIAKHFLLPYNRKLWARDPETMSCEWVRERVAGSDTETKSTGSDGGRRPLRHDTVVGYPKEGGFGAIFRALSRRIPKLECSAEVVRVDPATRCVVLGDGRRFGWGTLVSTAPLPLLCRMVTGIPVGITEDVERLAHVSQWVQLLLVGRRLDTHVQRIYLADPSVLPHKIALNHNSSDWLRKRPCHAITAEVSLSTDKPVDVDAIGKSTVAMLCECGILESPSDVVWQGHVEVEHAYPIYTLGRSETVRRAAQWLEQRGIHTVGRFGRWEYLNSDQCIRDGLALARRLGAQAAAS